MEQSTNQKSANNRNTRSLLLIIIVMVVSLVVGTVGGMLGAILVGEDGMQQFGISMNEDQDGNAIITADEGSIAAVAEKVSPSVVSIVTTYRVNSLYGAYEQDAAGTGVIISKNGYILTNNHVVEDAQSVGVVQSDGTTYKNVRVVGRDPLNDIAYLKIPNVADLPAATLGDSKTLRIGQRVVAIGNALGYYQNSVTSGIVSGTGRSVAVASSEYDLQGEQLSDLIQTDAAINPGNSGGPLVNMAGQVIGINTAVASGADNVGFVIPISAVKGTVKHLLASGGVQRPYLGVQYVSITPGIADQYDISVKQGAYIYTERGSAVVRGGPADKAGIQRQDVIVSVGGVKVGTAGDVATLVGEYAVGEKVELGIVRGSKELSVTVTLGGYNE